MHVELDPRGGGTVTFTRAEIAAWRAECPDCGFADGEIRVIFDDQDDVVRIEPDSVERDGNVYAITNLIFDAGYELRGHRAQAAA